MRDVRRPLAIGLAGISIATAAYSAATDLMPSVDGAASSPSPFEVIPVALFIWGTPLLGLLLALRRPDNPTGWLFLLLTIGWTMSLASDDLARHASPTPLVAALVVLGQQVGSLGFVSLFALLIEFPSGRLPSRRWRIVPALLVVSAVATSVGGLLTPGPAVQPPASGLENPFGSAATQPLATALETVGQVAFVAVAIGALALVAIRFRRSAGVERQQLKWFVSAGALTASLFVGALASEIVAPGSEPGNLLWALATSTIVLLPASATVAVLRYRLYDIDRIISRTIAYAVVTALLAVTYVAAFAVLAAAIAPLTADGGPVAVAASTLVVFALFAPVRRRIGALVDRRFNRARYDAEQTVEAFTTRVRDEVEVDRVAEALTSALGATVEPRAASVWLRAARG